MALTQAKQIQKNLIGRMNVVNFSAVGTSDLITTEVTAAASADGVPLQASTGVSTSTGFMVTSPFNKVEIIDTTSKDHIDDGSGNEVFGRLTGAPVYTLTYFSIQSGVESSVDLPATNIDFFIAYNYTFKDFPFSAGMRVPSVVVGDDPANQAGRPIRNEVITVTGINTINDFAKIPIVGSAALIVNGKAEDSGSGGSFSHAAKVITWIPGQAGFDLETTDRVVAFYNTTEA